MTDFTTYEYSQRASHAIYLYKFSDGTTSWYYLSGSENAITFDGNSYTPAVITHSAINQSQNPYDDVIQITAKTDLVLVQDTIGRFQSPKIYFSLYKIQNAEATLYKRFFYGYISDIVYNDETTVLKINSVLAALNKRVIKQKFSQICRHVLYSTACGLDPDAHKTAGTITGITDGNQIGAVIFNTATPGTYLSSKIVTEDGEERTIISDPGTGVVTILRPFLSAAVGTTFYVYDKCDRSFASCTAFSNTDNFGGFFIKNNPYESIDEGSAAILTNPVSEN